MTIPEDVLRSITKIFDGNCILFTGAGFSLSATNLLGENLKSAEQLKNTLFDKCNLDRDGTLDWAVENYVEKFSAGDLIKTLRDCFFVKTVSKDQKTIVEQLWKGIYTTNYDNVIETIFSDAKKQSRSTTISSVPSSFVNKRNLVVHINGFIEDLNEDQDLPQDFLLNRMSYITTEFINSDWHTHFQSDLITSDAIFFVGFSMQSDLDLGRIIYSAFNGKKDKIFFIVWEEESESSKRFLAKFGTVLPIGVSGFAELISDRKQKYVPRQSDALRLFSFKEARLISQASKITIKDVFELLVYGKVDSAHVESSLSDPTKFKYYIKRKVQDEIIKAISDGYKNILIVSDLGNGKSMLIEGIKIALLRNSYKVFYFEKWYDSCENEIQQICEKHPGAVLIIENYNHNLKLLEFLQTRRGKNMVVITSERSAVHDSTFHKLERFFGTDYPNYDINKLEKDEISVLINILDEYGLWVDYSSLTAPEKQTFVTYNCSSNLKLLLLKLIESKSILDKFKEIMDNIANEKNYFEALVLLLFSNLYNISLSIEQLVSILNDEKFRNATFLRNSAIKEIIDISTNEIKVKSSILSEMLLSKASSAHSIVQSLIRIGKQLDLWRDDQNSKMLLRELVSFGNIYDIIKTDRENYANAIDYYFDELRNLEFCKGNPHYWLQYAILNLERGQLELAKKQFDTAYSYARSKRNFDTYQLDNQYARYLLEFQLQSGNAKSCMPAFREAHQILTNSLSPNKLKYYPYKVAQLYVKVYDRFFQELSAAEKNEFYKMLKEMGKNIEQYLHKVIDHRVKGYVLRTQKQIRQITDSIEQA